MRFFWHHYLYKSIATLTMGVAIDFFVVLPLNASHYDLRTTVIAENQ